MNRREINHKELTSNNPRPLQEEMKHCPFCGGKAEITKTKPSQYTYWVVRCSECRVGTTAKTQLEKAISVWNRRAVE